MKPKLRTELRDLPVVDVPAVERPQPWVTVVLPTKDRREGAAAFLDSLSQAADPAHTEVLVYAPSEAHGLDAWLAGFGAAETITDDDVFEAGTPFCWSTLMNHAFRRARGEWVMYASDDIVLYAGALRTALSREHEAADVGGIAFLHRNTEETYGGFFEQYGYDTLLGERPYINFGLVRKSAYERTGGFDERYRFYWADVDLCMQVQDAGLRIAVSQTSLVDHVNVLDAVRAGNADAVFAEDTRAFAEKWRRHAFFRRRNPLHKVRYRRFAGPARAGPSEPRGPILIDAVIFQLQPHGGGISRLWTECLTRLAAGPLAEHILLLDREGTCPAFPSLRRRTVARYDDRGARRRRRDAARMRSICREEGAALFFSTYFTRTGDDVPSALFVYDCIPEVLGWDLWEAQWQAKQEAIAAASAVAVISESTRRDIERLYPAPGRHLRVVPCAAADAFRPRPEAEVEDFRARHGIDRPYFLFVGHRWPHKNVGLLLRAFERLERRKDLALVFTGGAPKLEAEWLPHVQTGDWHLLRLDDEDLARAYAGAQALVFPSRYEGFGMPVLEAMACACPVVTCPNSSLKEIGGEAALYVLQDDESAMGAMLDRLLEPGFRARAAAGGPAQAARYTWAQSAEGLGAFMAELAAAPLGV